MCDRLREGRARHISGALRSRSLSQLTSSNSQRFARERHFGRAAEACG
jgi:hypothetical protein